MMPRGSYWFSDNLITMSIKPSFWNLTWSSFVEIQGGLITFIGFFISILLYWFPVDTQIPLGVFIIV